MANDVSIRVAPLLHVARLLRENRPFTAQSAAEPLETSDRTIKRALQYLREEMGWTIHFDKADWTYVLVSAPPPKLF